MQASGVEALFYGNNFARLLGGLWVTIRIALISVAISMVMGVLLGLVMTKKSRVVRFL